MDNVSEHHTDVHNECNDCDSTMNIQATTDWGNLLCPKIAFNCDELRRNHSAIPFAPNQMNHQTNPKSKVNGTSLCSAVFETTAHFVRKFRRMSGLKKTMFLCVAVVGVYWLYDQGGTQILCIFSTAFATTEPVNSGQMNDVDYIDHSDYQSSMFAFPYIILIFICFVDAD